MTEDEARAWIGAQFDVPRETWKKLDAYTTLLKEGMEAQNLIARSTSPTIWARHIVDSAQLLPLSREAGNGAWVDLGSGAGLPGIVIAILSDRRMHLVESRRLRIDFLQSVIDALDLRHVTVQGIRVERATLPPAAVISARAYAPLPRLFDTSMHLADAKTVWLLPKGQNAQKELEAARVAWQGDFAVQRSVTDPDSAIIVARSVERLAAGARRKDKA